LSVSSTLARAGFSESQDLDEDVSETDPKSLDQHLNANFGVLSDAVELAAELGKVSVDSAPGSGQVSSASLSDCAWFTSELNHDVAKFQKMRAEYDTQRGMLETRETEYSKSVSANVRQATEA
jgi:hypothetical protein